MKQHSYALRLIGTELYLPRARLGQRPSELEPWPGEPRLFHSPEAATKALTQWRKGVHAEHMAQGDYESELEPRPHRAGLRFEIVVFSLNEERIIEL